MTKGGLVPDILPDNKPRAWKASTQWEQKLNELIIDAVTDGQPRFRENVWQDVFDRQKGLFATPIGHDSTEWTIWLSPDALWSRLRTLSHIAILEGSAADDFKAKVDGILKEGDCTWNEKGEVAVHGFTHFYWTPKL